MKKSMYTISVSASSFASGIINGLLGSGGGILLLFIMSYLAKKNSDDNKKKDTRDIFAQNITIVTAMSAVSAIVYSISGHFEIKSSFIYIIPAIIGGILGAFLLDKINTAVLKLIFSAITIYGGFRMVFR